MKIETIKSLKFNVTLDRSEAVMFNQGGKHSLDITQTVDEEFSSPFEKVEISFQMQRDQQGTFDFITNEAAKHRKQWDEIHAAETIEKARKKDEKTP